MCRSKGKTDIPGEEKHRRKKLTKSDITFNHLTHLEMQSDDTIDENDIYMFHIGSKLKSALYPVKIATQKVNLLTDSGSTLNCLDEQQCKNLSISSTITTKDSRHI